MVVFVLYRFGNSSNFSSPHSNGFRLRNMCNTYGIWRRRKLKNCWLKKKSFLYCLIYYLIKTISLWLHKFFLWNFARSVQPSLLVHVQYTSKLRFRCFREVLNIYLRVTIADQYDNSLWQHSLVIRNWFGFSPWVYIYHEKKVSRFGWCFNMSS